MNTFDTHTACFFTGHRIIPSDSRRNIYNQVREICIKLITENNVKDFICGGALGFDTLAANLIIELRKEYPHIQLHLYFPCTNQIERWSMYNKKIWESIRLLADDYRYISDMEYVSGCMQLRNKAMVNDALYGIAYCTRQFSGTASTIKYANEKERFMYIITD